MTVLPIFPQSGFDASAATPVLLGVIASWAFTEWFGWVLAGLVVPGYIAALFLFDPRAATVDVFEAVVTYAIARLLGEHLSKTGLTSRFFGRERFLLIVVISVVVRIGLEAALLPHLASHATWAFSIGLVVVPLAANACYKTGLVRGAVQNGVPTLIVWGLLRYVLLPHTNLSLGGFNLAMENVGASFLASPKIYILLLTCAGVAAFANVRWGWDYSGILVPALLSLVIVNPVKFAATIVEVVVLLGCVRGLLRFTPLGRVNIEGPRRLVLFFFTDYVLRFAFATALGPRLPGADVVEVMGFGYLIPSLLAVKASEKRIASLVVMPAVGVSGLGFVLGTLVGFGAFLIDGSPSIARAAVSRPMGRAPTRPRDAALWVSALAFPAAGRRTVATSTSPTKTARLVEDLTSGHNPQLPAWIWAERLGGGAVLVRERFETPADRVGDPAIVARAPLGKTRVVAVIDEPLSAPEAALLAGRALEDGVLDAIVVAGVDGLRSGSRPLASSAIEVARAIADRDRRGVVVAMAGTAAPTSKVRAWPDASADQRFSRLLAAVGECAAIDGSPTTPTSRQGEVDAEIEVARAAIRSLADPPRAQAPALGNAIAIADALAAPMSPVATASAEDLLVLRRLVLDPVLSAAPREGAIALAAHAATLLGWRLYGPLPLADGDEGVALLPGEQGRSLALIAHVRGIRGSVVEVPRATHEGLRDLGVRLATAIHADALLLGLAPNAGANADAALREAHAAATGPQPLRLANVVLLRSGSPEESEDTEIGEWGEVPSRTMALIERSLADVGLRSRRASLDGSVRERAGRTLLGPASLVSVTVNERAAHALSLEGVRRAARMFGGAPVVDLSSAEAARDLGRGLPLDGPNAPSDLMSNARRASVDESIAAGRALERAVLAGEARVLLARGGGNLSLVVAGRVAGSTVLGAFPLAPPGTNLHVDTVVAPSIDACAERVALGAVCRVGGP